MSSNFFSKKNFFKPVQYENNGSDFLKKLKNGQLKIVEAGTFEVFNIGVKKIKEEVCKSIGPCDYFGFTLLKNDVILCFVDSHHWSPFSFSIQKEMGAPNHAALYSLKEGFFSNIIKSSDSFLQTVRRNVFGIDYSGVSFQFFDEESEIKVLTFATFKDNQFDFYLDDESRNEYFDIVQKHIREFFPYFSVYLKKGSIDLELVRKFNDFLQLEKNHADLGSLSYSEIEDLII